MADAGQTIPLSVIIPVYNVGEYIRECLDSVTGQLRPGDQMILIDDGSTDGSGAVCDEYAALFPQIETLHQTNRGVAGARNAGLERARGEYIAWIDPDDWVEPDWREAIGAALHEYPADILIFDHILRYGEDKDPRSYGRPPGRLDPELLLADIVEDRIIQSGLCNKVMRRALYQGISFDETLRTLEDYAVLHHLIMRAASARYLPRFLYHYRIRGDGLTHLRGLDISYQSFLVARKRKQEIEQTGRRCSPLGMVLQARWFLHFYYMDNSPPDFRRQSLHCQWAVLSSARAILKQDSIDRHEKLRRLVWALPGVDALYRKREPRMT